jgi:hypothetical protein
VLQESALDAAELVSDAAAPVSETTLATLLLAPNSESKLLKSASTESQPLDVVKSPSAAVKSVPSVGSNARNRVDDRINNQLELISMHRRRHGQRGHAERQKRAGTRNQTDHSTTECLRVTGPTIPLAAALSHGRAFPERNCGLIAMCIITGRPCDERSTALRQFAPASARYDLAAMLSQTTRDPRRPQLATWSNLFWQSSSALCW